MQFEFNLMIKTVAQKCQNAESTKPVKLECRDVSISLRIQVLLFYTVKNTLPKINDHGVILLEN